MKPSHVPYPLIWGGSQPQLRVQLVGGEQILFSKTNYLLYLEEADFGESGTYTIARFLHGGDWEWDWELGLSGWKPYDSLPLDPKCVLPSCYRCNLDAPCRMLVEGTRETTYTFKGSGEVVALNTLVLRRSPQLEQCPVLTGVLRQCETDAERSFAELYYKWALLGGGYPLSLEGKDNKQLQKCVDAWHRDQLKARSFACPEDVSAKLVASLSLPALIPQVWLNYVHDPYVNPKDLEKTILRDMPSRVDFLLVKDGERHIIE